MLLMLIRRKKVTLKEMQSLLGQLVFASRVLPMGRVFSKRLYVSISGLKSPSSHVRLTSEIKGDLLVWLNFLEQFSGKSLWQTEFVCDSDFLLATDAVGSTGFGAISENHWCASAWPSGWVASGFCKNIVLLELFPVIVSLELWGLQFANRRILLSTDNKGVCFAVNYLSFKFPQVVSLLRHVVFLCLKWNIQGKVNIIADALPRLQMDHFFPCSWRRT